MLYLLAANTVLVLHLLFTALVMLGALVVARWPRFAVIHVPAVVWGFLVEAMGWPCPLTDVENWLLHRAGENRYPGEFIERLLLGLIYPEGLTRETQWFLAALVVLVNAGLYGWMLARRMRRKEVRRTS